MKEFFKEVGWNVLCFTGALILLTVAIVLLVIVAAPCFVVLGLLAEHWGKSLYTLLIGLAFSIVYWSIVDVISSAIWRKITGRPKLKRGEIYIEYAESGDRS
jgi:membrane protein implicated in regulation of membrane protease activity